MGAIVRFDLDLSDEELEALESLQTVTHRSRKNLCEALVKIAIGTHQNDGQFISMNDLGTIVKSE